MFQSTAAPLSTKGSDLWNAFRQTYTIWPIPQDAIDQNPKLKQNPGY